MLFHSIMLKCERMNTDMLYCRELQYVQKHNKFLSYNLLIWEIYFLPFISCGIKKYFKVHYIFSTMQYTKWENLIVNTADLNADDIERLRTT